MSATKQYLASFFDEAGCFIDETFNNPVLSLRSLQLDLQDIGFEYLANE